MSGRDIYMSLVSGPISMLCEMPLCLNIIWYGIQRNLRMPHRLDIVDCGISMSGERKKVLVMKPMITGMECGGRLCLLYRIIPIVNAREVRLNVVWVFSCGIICSLWFLLFVVLFL